MAVAASALLLASVATCKHACACCAAGRAPRQLLHAQADAPPPHALYAPAAVHEPGVSYHTTYITNYYTEASPLALPASTCLPSVSSHNQQYSASALRGRGSAHQPLVMPKASFAWGSSIGQGRRHACQMRRGHAKGDEGAVWESGCQRLLFSPEGYSHLQCIVRHACRMRRGPTPHTGALHMKLTSLGLGFLTSAAHAA